MTKAQQTARQKLIREVALSLGQGMVRVELTPEHYELAVDLALDRYRQRSSNSVLDRVAFLELQPHQTEYILPDEVIEVRDIHRRGTTGTASGTGANFDPFGSAFVNQLMLGASALGNGGLLTYELAAQRQELVGRMFGLEINFHYDPQSKRLQIVRNIKAPETVLLTIYCYRPEDALLSDQYARPWLRDYTAARCKIMLGEARSKFASIVGPQGGTQLNGESLKQEGLAELERLEHEVANQFDQNIGYGFIIG